MIVDCYLLAVGCYLLVVGCCLLRKLAALIGLALADEVVRFQEAGAVGGAVFAHAEGAPAADGIEGLAGVGGQIGRAPMADAAHFAQEEAPRFRGGEMPCLFEDDLVSSLAQLGDCRQPFAVRDMLQDGRPEQRGINIGQRQPVHLDGLRAEIEAGVG